MLDSAQFQLSCKGCSTCECDSALAFSSKPYISHLDNEVKVTDSLSCGSESTTANLVCNKNYQFAIAYHIPPGLDSCTITDSAVITDAANNVIASQTSVTPANPLSYTFTQSGTYCITYYLKINGKVCKTCKICVSVSCPQPPPCNACRGILNSAFFELDSLISKNGYQIQTGNVSLSTISSFQEISLSIADIEYSWQDEKCHDCKMHTISYGCIYPSSSGQIIGGLVLDSLSGQLLPVGSNVNACPGEIKWITGVAATAGSYNVPLQISLPQGLIPSCCTLKVNKLCLRVSIKNLDCETCDTVICFQVRPPCCKGGMWLSKTLSQNGGTNNPTIISNAAVANTTITCGQTYTVNSGTSYTFNANYQCSSAPNCSKKVKVSIKDPNGNTTINNAPLNKTFSLPGTYTITYLAYCGNTVCDSCVFYLVVPKDCCKNSKWTQKKITVKKANGQNSDKIITDGSSYSSNGPANVTVAFQCAATCNPSYSWKRWRNGNLLDSASYSATSAIVQFTLAPPSIGCDSVVITAYCDGTLCATLRFKLCCLVCSTGNGNGNGTGSIFYYQNQYMDLIRKERQTAPFKSAG